MSAALIQKTLEIPRRKLQHLFEQYIVFRTVNESKGKKGGQEKYMYKSEGWCPLYIDCLSVYKAPGSEEEIIWG